MELRVKCAGCARLMVVDDIGERERIDKGDSHYEDRFYCLWCAASRKVEKEKTG